jgi:pyruvate/2-oxoacid:ferredoxin oxidoreductase alpha subunit
MIQLLYANEVLELTFYSERDKQDKFGTFTYEAENGKVQFVLYGTLKSTSLEARKSYEQMRKTKFGSVTLVRFYNLTKIDPDDTGCGCWG